MLKNTEYIDRFISKHHYDGHVHLQCHKTIDEDGIKSVIFSEKDVPGMRKISIDDIKYDIDSDLPEDVFYRYLEYLSGHDEVTYIYWMTEMDNRYFPMGIDTSASESIRREIYESLEDMKKMKWF